MIRLGRFQPCSCGILASHPNAADRKVHAEWCAYRTEEIAAQREIEKRDYYLWLKWDGLLRRLAMGD